MKLEWVLDGENIAVDRNPTEPLSLVLMDLRLQTQHACWGEWVKLDSRVYPAQLLPLYRIRGKEVLTAEGFFTSIGCQRFLKLLESRHGSVCPLCIRQRLFLMDTDLDRHRNYQENRLLSTLGMIPCVCGREAEYLASAAEYFREMESQRGPR